MNQTTEANEPARLSTCATAPKTIFFSYGHDDNQQLVDAFKIDLEKRGHSVWIDYKQIGTWHDWRGRITQGVHESDLAVAFLSKHSTRDPGVCRNEVALALNRFGTVYPVLLEPVLEVSPPVTLSHLQWQDLSQWRAIHAGQVPGKDWARWYEEKLLQLVTLVEGAASEFTGDIQALREVLQPVAFSNDIARHIPDFVGREWVFEAYEQWLAQRTESRLLWIKGGPGLGKSAIAANLVHNHQSAVVGAWFCQSNSLERSDARTSLCSLAFQLACRWDDYRSKLRLQLGLGTEGNPTECQRLRELLLQKNEADLFHHLLAEPLTGLIWREQRLVVVIDALDEATDEHGRNALVDLLVTRLATLPAWLAFVVTSRPNPDVVAKLAGYAPFEFDPHEARNHDDLKAYLHTVLGRRADFLACSVQKQERILYRLLELSEGMILYLRQLVQGLEEGAITLAALDRIPPGLASLYRINFEHKYGGERIGVYDSEVRPLLRLLVAAPGPMPAELARTALGWDRETYASRRDLLGSNVIDMPQGLRLFHQSLYEWLAKIDSSPFYVDADEGALILGNFLWKCCSETGDDDEIQWAPQVQHWLPELLPRMPLWNCIDPLRWMGNYLLRMKRYASGERLLRRVLHLAEATEGPLSMAAATAQKDLARLLSAGGDTKGAAAFYSQALQIQQQLLGPGHREVARTTTELAHAVFPINRTMLMNYREGYCLGPELDWTVPEQMFQMVVNIHEQGSEPQDLAAAHLDLGYVLEILGRLDEAERYYRLALEVEHKGTELRNDWPALQRLDDLKRWRERLAAREQQYEEVAALEAKYGPNHLVVEEALHSIARNVQSIGWEAAAPLYERVLQIREQRLGVAHEDVADLLTEMAYWAEDENLKETLESRALSIREQVLGQDHAQLLDPLRMLGHYRDRAGDFAAAEALWCRALAIMERDEGPFGKEVAYMLGLLAGLQHKRRHYAAAVELRQRVLAIREARLQEDHSSLHDVEDALSELGKSLSRCCDFIAAEAVLRRALALSHECYGQRFVDGGPYAARNFRELGLVLSAQGDYAGAAPLLRRAVEGYERWLEIDSPHKLGNLADALESLVGVLQVQQQHGDVKRLRERACTLLAQAKAAGYSPEHPALQMLQSLAFPANEEEKPNQ